MKLFTTASQQVTNAALVTAFENDTGLSANEYPMVLALFESAVCDKHKIKNSVESEGSVMALNLGTIKSRLSFFDAAVKEVLTKGKNYEGKKLIEFVQKDTDFNQMLYSIVKKYLSFYENVDDIYDIVISAFSALFLDNFNKVFKDFDGIYIGDGGKESNVKIEAMIYKLLSRAIIQESKNLSKHLKDRHELKPFENESEEDALDREVGDALQKFSISDQKLYNQLLELLRKKMKKKKNFSILEKVLQHLLLGHSATDISKKLGVSTTRVGDHVWYLKYFIQEVAKDLNKQGDSDLLNTLETSYKMVK